MRASWICASSVPAVLAWPWSARAPGTRSNRRAKRSMALRHGLDLGMRHLDTAEMYGSGAAETLVGRAIEGRRDEVFLVSKVLPSNASRRGTIAACERSLARLKTDRLDCYLLHWRGAHPLEDTVAAFEELRASGKISCVGREQFRRRRSRGAGRARGGRAARLQSGALSPARARHRASRCLPWCREHGVAMVAYTPFGESRSAFRSADRQGRVLQEIARLARGDRPSSRARVSLAPRLRHPEGCAPGSRERECGRRRAALDRRRVRPHRRRVPARQAAPAAHALRATFRSEATSRSRARSPAAARPATSVGSRAMTRAASRPTDPPARRCVDSGLHANLKAGRSIRPWSPAGAAASGCRGATRCRGLAVLFCMQQSSDTGRLPDSRRMPHSCVGAEPAKASVAGRPRTQVVRCLTQEAPA